MPTGSSSASSKRARPRGLWKARATPRGHVPDRQPPDSDSDAHHDDDDCDSDDLFLPVYKRRHTASSDNGFSSDADNGHGHVNDEDDDHENDDDHDNYRWDFARRQLCGLELPDRESGWIRRRRIMDSTSTAFGGSQTDSRKACDLEDWMDLKDLFAKAAEQYETEGPADALPLLRGVVHECHAFLNYYEDPSVLFAGPREADTPPEEKPKRNWNQVLQRPKCTCVELPTAFHAILGNSLFLFGNLIDQDATLALPGEPDSPIPYWLAALDVFETGENLPSRVNGTGCDAPEDWRMAIIWGRTLVALADATVSREPANPDCVMSFSADEPDWPSESPFAAIAMRRPPLTRRMTLTHAKPNDLIVLAMDQFSRGIFHMPHPQHKTHRPSLSCCKQPEAPSAKPPILESFSRPKELYTIASEVLLLSEKLPRASERQFWASYSDSVLNQMKMEADMEAWRPVIARARGRCWLIAGSACADELEDRLEEGDLGVLDTEEAADAREDLEKAVAHLERGRVAGQGGEEEQERRKMLVEALMTLGNLTIDKTAQEMLYRRAEEEGGDVELMDVDE